MGMKSTGRYLWSLISKLGKSGARRRSWSAQLAAEWSKLMNCQSVGVKVVVGNLLQTQAAERVAQSALQGHIPQMSQLVRKVAGHPAS